MAMTMALLLFLIPSRTSEPGGSRALLDVSVFRRLPWHIVLLFGGGFALAQGFRVTGLSELIGTRFASLEGTPPYLMLTLVCGGLTFLTELTSNTATTELLLPVVPTLEQLTAYANPERPSVGRREGSTCAEFQGSGPRQRRKVAGLKVPAPTSMSYGCTRTQPCSAQYCSRAKIRP